jgi:hypothetical protein
VLILRGGRLFRGVVAVAVRWVCSEGLSFLSAPETRYERIRLRRAVIVRVLGTVSIGVGSWSCKDEADGIYLLGVMWIRDMSHLLHTSLTPVSSLTGVKCSAVYGG